MKPTTLPPSLFNPFVLKFDLSRQYSGTVIASLAARQAGQARELREAELTRRACVPVADANDDFVGALSAAADQYIVRRGEHETIIAGSVVQ